jgi:alkane 1-monooxygenase
MLRDLKYLTAYIIPLSAALALWLQGVWAWSTVVLAFGLIPIIELFVPANGGNTPEVEEPPREKNRLFDWLLYLNVPLVFGISIWYFILLKIGNLSWPEIVGLTLSTGIVLGANGINVAHELGHRTGLFEQRLAQLLLLPNLYQHFFVEHNRGHHKYVATDRDPATARYGESVYAFWVRSVIGSWRSAWQIERERLQKAGQSFWSWHNMMVRFSAAQTAWLVGVATVFGGAALLGALAIALGGILLLETINYLEHYGLQRRMMDSGRPEPVMPIHSWNSNHELGRIFLYELTRHSDHHYKASRKYQIIRHMEQSPQLPYGYPTSMILALLPPVWFSLMNERAREARELAGVPLPVTA